MAKSTLRTFLFETRLELYEQISEIKNEIINGEHNTKLTEQLAGLEAQLSLIRQIIQICIDRGSKY